MSKHNEIPDAAVEAAAKALARVDDWQWGPIPRYLKDTHLMNARLALDAAEPYLRPVVETTPSGVGFIRTTAKKTIPEAAK